MAELKLGDDFTPVGTEQPVEEAKETPAESPTVEKPVEVADSKQDADVLEKQLQGLQQEKAKLLEEVKHLRGTKRELKQEELVVVQKELDDLKDVNPQDVELFERVLRSKGYVNKAEANKMFYESVKDQVVSQFLEKYPEYKPENDSQDVNWNALTRELADYRMPQNPHDIMRVLEKGHKAISKVSDQSIPQKVRAVQTASAGSGGIQRSSSSKSFDPAKRRAFEEGGWTEEEIKALESKLK